MSNKTFTILIAIIILVIAFISWLSWTGSESSNNPKITPNDQALTSPLPNTETPLPEEQQDITRWPTYTHKNGFYKIKFPPQWHWRRSLISETEEIVGFDDNPLPELNDGYSGKIFVKIINQSRIDFVNDQEKLLKEITKEDIVLDGETATKMRGKLLENSELFPEVVQEYIVVERNKRTFVISSSFVADQNIKSIFDGMISSFDLLR